MFRDIRCIMKSSENTGSCRSSRIMACLSTRMIVASPITVAVFMVKELTCQRAFPEKVATAKYGEDTFASRFRNHRELDLAFPDVKYCVRTVTLREDHLPG